jgi:hypothetical protein
MYGHLYLKQQHYYYYYAQMAFASRPRRAGFEVDFLQNGSSNFFKRRTPVAL